MNLEPGLSQETKDTIAARRAKVREKRVESITADPVAPELHILQADLDIPAHLLPLDKELRTRWSRVAALGIISVALRDSAPGVGYHVLVTMIANGPDEFERVARPQFEGHAFHREDYVRMYHIIKGELRRRFGLNEDVVTRKVVIANG